MSLPPGFLDELRSRLSLVQVAGRKVTWDTRKSNQGRGDMWAPCPFHQEKTASFHVDDRKGFYYCFGCHAKGDVFRFVQETENMGFMEAVELLAREAGLSMPARDPQAQEKADRRTQLADVAEQAAQFFRMQLATGAGAAARDYLTGRGLGDAARDRWEIGFAPDGWQNLWDHLRSKGIAEELILDAGLARPSSKGGKPYDVFRNRIMFPIRDARGRCIAFGGRAMDPNDNAKYLNSPETALFDKGRSLFNHGPAREAAGKGQPLLVAEGYMDVIALAGAGFEASVAPLGTAITETQLQLLWRIAPEPVIALDGDTAGLRAAMRLIDLALPLLEPGKSLRFALMPDKMDPDDLIRSRGASAMQALIDAAIPMVDLLWRRETEGKVFDSPERKAALEKTLKDRAASIRDQTLRNHYERALRDLQWQLFRPARKPGQPGRGRDAAAAGPTPVTRASALVSAGEQAEERIRIEVILAAALVTPEVVHEFEAGFEDLPCADREQARLRDLILRHAGAGAGLAERIAEEIGPAPLENLLSLRHVAISPCLRKPGDIEVARMTVAEELAKLKARRGAMAEIEEAAEELTGAADEALTWRLGQAAEARNRAERSETKDRAEYDIGDNGARIDRSERSALDALLEGIRFDKSRR